MATHRSHPVTVRRKERGKPGVKEKRICAAQPSRFEDFRAD